MQYPRGAVSALLAALVCLVFLSRSEAADPLAYVTEVKGKAAVAQASGKKQAAAVGLSLFAGDQVQVEEGRVVVVYVSGRSVEVKAGEVHRVQADKSGGETRLERLMGTLDEMIGAQEEADRPVVHGMARNLPLTGATPANTRISTTDFHFSWDALEGAEAYVFELEAEDGRPLVAKTLQDTTLAADSLGLEPGKTYVWSVRAEFLIPHSTGKNRLEIASQTEADTLRVALEEIDRSYTGTTGTLLKAAACYKSGYLFEAQHYLLELKGRDDVASVHKMLRLIQGKMQTQSPVPSAGK